MSNRINELIIAATVATEERTPDGFYYKVDLHKFAELIIRECVQACIEEGKTYEVESAGEYQSNLYVTAIKKHFGVEE